MIESALEGEAIYGPLRKLADEGDWTGTVAELLDKLIGTAGLADAKKMPDGWPKTPKSLGHQLKRLAPALRTLGIYVTYERKNTERLITVSKSPQGREKTSQTSPLSQAKRQANLEVTM
jgi:hypothetical protein